MKNLVNVCIFNYIFTIVAIILTLTINFITYNFAMHGKITQCNLNKWIEGYCAGYMEGRLEENHKMIYSHNWEACYVKSPVYGKYMNEFDRRYFENNGYTWVETK